MNRTKDKKYCLITTSDERFWDDEAPLLFMDEGCCRYSQRKKLIEREYIIYKPRWSNRKCFDESVKYLKDLEKRILCSLHENLNIVHDVNYDEKSWYILLGWWLKRYLSFMYYKYENVKDISEQYKIYNKGICSSITVPYYSTYDFMYLSSSSDLLNGIVGNDVCEWLGLETMKELQIDEAITHVDYNSCENVSILYKILSWLSRKRTIIDYDFELLPNRKGFFKLWKYIVKSDISYTSKSNFIGKYEDVKLKKSVRRNVLSDFLSKNDFEHFIVERIKSDLPEAYLEAFDDLKEQAITHFGSNKKVFLSHNAWFTDEIAKAYIGSQREWGLKLCGIQHGGTSLYKGDVGYFDIQCVDKYYTWGWTWDVVDCDIVPMPSVKLSREDINAVESVNRDGVLYIGTTDPRYVIDFRYPHMVLASEYISSQVLLIKKIAASVNDFRVRLYPNDYGWDISERLIDSEVNVESCNVPWEMSCRQAKLCIFDILMTTWTEAYVAGTPIIFVVNSLFEDYLDENQIVEELVENGIYHRNLDEAIEYINSIDDYMIWWNDSHRQLTMKKFAEKYTNHSKDYLKIWFEEMINIKETKE